MELTRFEPGKLMSDLLDDMWFPFGGRERPFGRQTMRPFEADVVELGNEIRVTAELPGVNRDDIDIALENNVLTISGEKTDEYDDGDGDGRYHLLERRWGRFSRSFALPRRVDQDAVQATFEDGILTVRVPKSEDSRRRRIEIGAGKGKKQLSEGTR